MHTSPRHRSSSSTCPMRCIAATKATTSYSARSALTTKRRTSCSAPRSCASSRRWSTSRWPWATTSITSSAARWASRCSPSSGAGSCPHPASSGACRSTRIFRTRGGTTQPSTAPRQQLRADLPTGVALEAQFANISDVIDRKAAGIALYASQLPRLFESEQAMLDDLYGYHSRVALAGGSSGYAERFWSTVKA